MGAQEVKIQPRRTPPKAKAAAQAKQLIEAKVDQAQFEAQITGVQSTPGGVPEGAQPFIESEFPEIDKMPDLVQSIVAKGEAPVPPPPAISNVDLAAGIPSPAAPEQIVESNAQNPGVVLAPVPQAPTPTPPKTREQYIAQQRGDTGAYPDVADIFKGKIPNHQPLNNPFDALRKEPVAPPPVREVIVTHEPPPKAAAYQLTKAYRGFLGDSFVEFDRGQVIYEATTIDQLLRGGFDGLVPLEVAEQFTTCPVCSHQFPAQAGQ